MRQARGLGISTEKAADYLLQRLMNRFAGTPRRRVLVVDCNQDVISDLSSGIQDRIGAETKGVLIQTLEAADDTAGFFEGIDLVVCGINHVEEFRRAVPDCPVELVGVWLRPDLKVMNALLNLPPGSRVGYTCVNQRSTETLFNTQFFSTGSSLVRVLTGFDRESGLPDMLASCDIIFATHYVYDRLKKMGRARKTDRKSGPAPRPIQPGPGSGTPGGNQGRWHHAGTNKIRAGAARASPGGWALSKSMGSLPVG